MQKPVVVILAGGQGKRFKPLTVDKTLFPVCGKPLIQYSLEMLARTGITDVVVTCNDDNQDFLKSVTIDGLTIKTVYQPEPLGMADALLKCESTIAEQPVLVMNAVDMVEDSLLTQILEKTSSAYAVVPGIKMNTYFPGGYLKVDGDRVTSIVEKPAEGTQPSDFVKLVFDYYSKPADLFAHLKTIKSENDDVYEKALDVLMQEHEVTYVPYTGYWQALKYNYYILNMIELFLQHKIKRYTAKSAFVSPHASVEGEVYIDEHARVEAGAVIKGPAYIGRNVIVGNHSLVRQSVIEEKTIVGFGSEVARSYIGPSCMLHHNFIGDSVLESHINPSYGTVTANFRFDNKPVAVKMVDKEIPTTRTKLGAIIAKGLFSGVNCAFMPGITIGENARIFPATVVYKPVAAGEIVKKTS